MMIETEVLNAADTATLLTAKLGQLKSWTFFLADNIRDRQDLAGLQLLPYAAEGPEDGACPRPLYRRIDIDTFVQNVLIAGFVKAPAIKPIMVTVDNAHDLPWRARRATRIRPPTPPRRAKAAHRAVPA